jgi:ribosomal protein S18 acetylase RimI-like enzyme
MEAAVEVASNLRKDDYREVFEGHGHYPLLYLPLAAFNGDTVWFEVPNGRTAGMAGVQEGGKIWMLCTDAIHKYPLTFAREAKRFVESREEKLLWNIVDKRNTAHLKLLKFLGFKFLRELEHGPNKLTFIEFCRVRTSNNGYDGSRRDAANSFTSS